MAEEYVLKFLYNFWLYTLFFQLMQLTVSSSSCILLRLNTLRFYCLKIIYKILFDYIRLEPIQRLLGRLTVIDGLLLFLFLPLLIQILIFGQHLTPLLISPIVGLIGIHIPSVTLLLLLFAIIIILFQRIPVQVKLILTDSFRLYLLLLVLLLLKPLSLLSHLVVVCVVLPDLFLQSSSGVENLGLVEFQLQVKELVDVLLTELLSHLLCDNRRLFYLLIIIVVLLLLQMLILVLFVFLLLLLCLKN